MDTVLRASANDCNYYFCGVVWQAMKDPLAMLKRRQGTRSQKALAEELGITPSYLCDVLQRRRDPGPQVLRALGLERVVTYREIRE